MTFKPTAEGTYYYHIKTKSGKMYYAGPYVIYASSKNLTGTDGKIDIFVTTDSPDFVWNVGGGAVSITNSKGGLKDNASIRAVWIKDGDTAPTASVMDNATKYSYSSITSSEAKFNVPDPTGVKEGYYRLYVKAYGASDTYGTAFTEYRNSGLAGFDFVAPTLTVSGETGSSGWSKSDVTLTVNASDATSGISKIQYSNDGKKTWLNAFDSGYDGRGFGNKSPTANIKYSNER